MSFSGITNINQYAAIQNYKTNPAKQSQSTTPTDTKANEPKTDTPKAESDNKNDAVKMDLATRKALAKGPLDEAEIQRRIADREGMRNVDINDVRKSMEASRPHAAEIEQSKANAEKGVPIQNKMLSGKPLTAEEKNFLREHFPDLYAAAIRIEEEVKMLKEQLSGCKSKEDADKLITQKKMQVAARGKGDNLASSLIAAFDEAYRSYKM